MRIFLLLFALGTFFTNINAQSEMEKVNSILNELKEKFAPDKRTAIFDLEVNESESKLIIKGETNLPQAKSELEKTLKEVGLNFTDEIDILPSKDLGNKIYGVISDLVISFNDVFTSEDVAICHSVIKKTTKNNRKTGKTNKEHKKNRKKKRETTKTKHAQCPTHGHTPPHKSTGGQRTHKKQQRQEKTPHRVAARPAAPRRAAPRPPPPQKKNKKKQWKKI